MESENMKGVLITPKRPEPTDEDYFKRFMASCFYERSNYRDGIDREALSKLRGEFLEKAKLAILEALQDAESLERPIHAARALDLEETIPLLEKRLSDVNSDKENKDYLLQSVIAKQLYEITDESTEKTSGQK